MSCWFVHFDFSIIIFISIYLIFAKGSKCVKSRLHSSPNFNSTGFDDAWQAWSSSIHFVSGEGWSDLMHAVIDGTNLFSSAVFIVFLIVGHFVLVNFFVVVITKLMSHRINIFAQNEKNDSQLKAIKLLDDTYELVKKYLEEKYDKFWENYTPVMLLKMQESLMTHWVLNPLITTFENCFFSTFFCLLFKFKKKSSGSCSLFVFAIASCWDFSIMDKQIL